MRDLDDMLAAVSGPKVLVAHSPGCTLLRKSVGRRRALAELGARR
jgi:predicted alpha/beta hydrolase family esterase